MRIRTVKPEYWSDELIATWPFVSRLAYIALWNEADDEGRLRANFQYLKAHLFPYDQGLDMEKALDPVIKSGRLVIFTAEGQTYGFLPNFQEHQVISHPTRSRLPSPSDGILVEISGGQKAVVPESSGISPGLFPEDSGISPGGLQEGSRKTTAGKEGKGKDIGSTPEDSRRKKGKATEEGFEEFWTLYPIKAGKMDAERAWKKLTSEERAKAIKMAPVFAKATEGQEKVKYPQGWLSGRRFNDDPASWSRVGSGGNGKTPAPALKRGMTSAEFEAERAKRLKQPSLIEPQAD